MIYNDWQPKRANKTEEIKRLGHNKIIGPRPLRGGGAGSGCEVNNTKEEEHVWEFYIYST